VGGRPVRQGPFCRFWGLSPPSRRVGGPLSCATRQCQRDSRTRSRSPLAQRRRARLIESVSTTIRELPRARKHDRLALDLCWQQWTTATGMAVHWVEPPKTRRPRSRSQCHRTTRGRDSCHRVARLSTNRGGSDYGPPNKATNRWGSRLRLFKPASGEMGLEPLFILRQRPARPPERMAIKFKALRALPPPLYRKPPVSKLNRR
jgi:hypothetical protein